MDEEVCYSSVSFIKSEESKTRETQDAEETVYSEVKRTEAHRGLSPSPAAADAKPLPGPHRYHSAVVALTDTAVPLPGPHRYRSVVVALGLLTALLLSLLVALLVYYRIHVYESNALLERELHQLKGKHTSLLTEFTLVKTHNANLSSSNEMSQARYENASDANEHLLSEMAQLQQVKKTLMMERDHLNQTLEVIFQFSDFPVGHFCPVTTQERKCSGYCKEGWEYYKSSCYHFIYIIDWYYWKSWEESEADCAKMGAHLVTIDTAEEQGFINTHTKFAYEGYGYWIGLSKIEGKWQWVNGSELTSGYWISMGDNYCVVAMPSTDRFKSWKDMPCYMKNRWICEMEAAIWPD